MAAIDELPYRDPRTAFGGAATAKRPQIPVGTATPATMGQFQAAQAATAGPAAGIGAMPAPPQAATTPAAPTPAKPGIGGKMGALGPAAGAALVGAPEALKVGQVLADPKSTGIDVATQAAEGTGRAAATTAGAIGGAKLGAMAAPFLGPLAPAGPVLGGLAGGAIGYFSANKAIEGGRAAAGVDTQSPVDRVAAPQPATGIGAMPAKQVQATQPAAAVPTEPAAPAASAITFDPKTKTYSGTDVKEGASISGGLPGGRGTGRGSVTSLDTSEGFRQNQMEAQRLVAERLDREAAMPGNQPGGGLGGINGKPFGYRVEPGTATYTPEGATQESAVSRIRDLTNTGGLSPSQAVQAVSQEDSRAEQRRTSDQNAQLSRRSQDIGVMSQQAGNRAQRDIATIQGNTQRDVANIGSDARVAAAEARGAQPNKFTPVLMPDQMDPATGQVVRGGQALMNNQTGEVTYPGQGAGAKQTAQVTPKAEYDKMPKGARYVGPDGKTYIKG